MARCGNRLQREHRKGRSGRREAFCCFVYAARAQGADRLTHHCFCLLFLLAEGAPWLLPVRWLVLQPAPTPLNRARSKLVLVEMVWSRLVQEPPNLRGHIHTEWGKQKGGGLGTARSSMLDKIHGRRIMNTTCF